MMACNTSSGRGLKKYHLCQGRCFEKKERSNKEYILDKLYSYHRLN